MQSDNRIKFFVPGIPSPRQSVRAFVKNGKVMHYQKANDAAAMWRETVKLCSLERRPPAPLMGAVGLILTFKRPRPSTLPKRVTMPIKRPDLDNYEKPVLDILQGVFFMDDSQIVEKMSRKEFSATPGLEIEIYPVEELF